MPKREAFKYGRGRCIFCGKQPPEIEMSQEHIFADWLRDYIPRQLTDHRTQRTLVDLEKEEVSERRRTGDPHARRVRCVCKTCNNGWMGRLQENVRPFLVPMLTGKSIRLHKRAQTILAAWIAMTTMVAEYVDRELVSVPQSDRDWLYQHKTAPKCWRIWVAGGKRQTYALHSHRALIMISPEEEIESVPVDARRAANTQTTTLCLGKHLIVHAMSSVVAWSIIRRWKLPAPIRDLHDQIWPIRAGIVVWPQAHSLNDAGIALLTDNFFDAATRLMRERARGSS